MAQKFLTNVELDAGLVDGSNSTGTSGYVLSSTGTATSWVDPGTLTAEAAEVVQVPVKNLQGSALTKGDPVYISGSVGASGRLEVKLADANDDAKMPAVGLLAQDLAINGEGYAVVTGKLRNLITSPINGVTTSGGEVLYVKPNGTTGSALTTVKPTGVNFIQNVGKVGRASTSTSGTLVVSSILRSNDVPTPLYIDHDNQRVGIDEQTPTQKLHVNGSALFTSNATVRGDLIIDKNPSNYPSAKLQFLRNGLTSPAMGEIIMNDNPGHSGMYMYARRIMSPYTTSYIELPTSTSYDFEINLLGSNAVTIDSYTRNFGIGTTSPTQKLHVNGNALVSSLYVGNTNNAIYNYVNSLIIQAGSGNSISLGGGPGNVVNNVGVGNGNFNVYNGTLDVNGTMRGKNYLYLEDAAGTLRTTLRSESTYATLDNGSNVFNYNANAHLFLRGFSEVMRVHTNNNVGIGTTSPSQKLEVAGAAKLQGDLIFDDSYNVVGGDTLELRTGGSTKIVIDSADNGVLVDNGSGGLVSDTFKSNFDDNIFTGSVGIGTSSPTQKLDVNGNVIASRYYGSGSTTYYVDPNNTTQAAYFAGDIRITDSSTATIKLDSTSIYPGSAIIATKNGSESPNRGELAWLENPGIQGSQWIARQSSSPYTASSILLPTSTSRDFEVIVYGTERFRVDSSTGNFGIGTTTPSSKLQVNGAVQVGDDAAAASASKVGALRYRTSGNNSYVDMCMQTGASTYAWVNIVQNTW